MKWSTGLTTAVAVPFDLNDTPVTAARPVEPRAAVGTALGKRFPAVPRESRSDRAHAGRDQHVDPRNRPEASR